jgi:hypothetical protein
MTSHSVLGRSNRKQHFLLDFSDGRSTVMTVHGGGVGAWCKAWDRTMAQLFAGQTVRHLEADVVVVDGVRFTFTTTEVQK